MRRRCGACRHTPSHRAAGGPQSEHRQLGGQLPTEGGALHRRRARLHGQGGPDPGPARKPRRVEPLAVSRGSHHSSGRTGRDSSSRTRAHPLRAHDGLAFRLLPGSRLRDGVRPCLHPQFRVARAGLWRRAPDELRHLRLAGADAHVRHERLRRDPARAVGMGREAPRGRASRWPRARGDSPTRTGAPWCCRWCAPTAKPCALSPR